MIRELTEAPTPGFGFTFHSLALVVGSGTAASYTNRTPNPAVGAFGEIK